MSFLDEVPQDWSGPEFPALRDLLVAAYRRPGPLERAADEAGLLVGTFPFADDLRGTCTELIKVIGAQRKLRRLLEIAATDPVTAAYHDRLREQLEAAPPVPAPAERGGRPGAPDLVRLAHWQTQRLMEKRSRLIGIELAGRVTETAAGVAKLTLRFGARRAFGTGFLIADDLILTAYHNVLHDEYGRLTEALAEFDHDLTPRTDRMVRRPSVDPVAGDPDADWAVLRLDQPTRRTPLVLGGDLGPSLEDLLVIIQHPQGAYKQFALEPLAVTDVDERNLAYLADTQAGSSGSPVCNARMQVVALHVAEAEFTVEVHGETQTVWRNVGVRIEPILRELEHLGITHVAGRTR